MPVWQVLHPVLGWFKRHFCLIPRNQSSNGPASALAGIITVPLHTTAARISERHDFISQTPRQQ
jgi:hypothetical protein